MVTKEQKRVTERMVGMYPEAAAGEIAQMVLEETFAGDPEPALIDLAFHELSMYARDVWACP